MAHKGFDQDFFKINARLLLLEIIQVAWRAAKDTDDKETKQEMVKLVDGIYQQYKILSTPSR